LVEKVLKSTGLRKFCFQGRRLAQILDDLPINGVCSLSFRQLPHQLVQSDERWAMGERRTANGERRTANEDGRTANGDEREIHEDFPSIRIACVHADRPSLIGEWH